MNLGLALFGLLFLADEAASLNNLGVQLAENGEIVRALPVLRRARYLAPDAIEIAGNLANVQLRLGEVPDAARAVDWIFSRLEGNERYRPWAYALRAELRLARDDGAGAMLDADAAVRAAEGRALDAAAQAAMRSLRGRVALCAGRWEEAARDFSAALDLAGSDPETPRLAGYFENYSFALRRIKGKGREASRSKRRAREMQRRLGVR